METLGLTPQPARSEGRLKSLLWPEIENAYDVDYIGAQGYWICTLLAFVALLSAFFVPPLLAVILALFYYTSGVGVRQHSRYAAVVVFSLFARGAMVIAAQAHSMPSIFGVIATAVLLSNVRATWMASHWARNSPDEVLPTPEYVTLTDKFDDQLPRWLWPRINLAYYVSSALLLALIFADTFHAFGSTAASLR